MDLVQAARTFEGTPFRHQGRAKWALDCAGLLILSALKMGKAFDDIKGYSRSPDGRTLKAELDRQLNRVSREAEYGDVLLMRFGRAPQHLAIKTDKGIIHAYEAAGGVVEHRLDDKWSRRIIAVYEL